VFTPRAEHPFQSATDGAVHVSGEADWQASYCSAVTSYFPIRNPFANVTTWFGSSFEECPDSLEGDPIVKDPAGTCTHTSYCFQPVVTTFAYSQC